MFQQKSVGHLNMAEHNINNILLDLTRIMHE